MTKSLSEGLQNLDLGLRPVEGPAGMSRPDGRRIMGVYVFRSTDLGHPPSVVLWVQVLLF